MQTTEERAKRFIPQENNEHENNVIPQRYGIGYKFDSEIINNKIVLDAGCAFGAGTKYLLESGNPAKIIAVDINKDVYEREKINNPKIEFKHSFLWDTKQKDNSVDVIYFIETIEHNDFEERDLIIKEFHRILKKGGLVVLTTPSKRTYNTFPAGSHFIEYTDEELLSIMKTFGFESMWIDTNIGENSMGFVFQKVDNGAHT